MNMTRSLVLATALAVAGPLWASPGHHETHHEGHHAKSAGAAKSEQKDWGVAGSAKAVKRTVELRMGDNMRFTPDTLQVQQGETVRIVVHNDGKEMHEFVIGTKQELDQHAAMMLKHPGMEHDEPYMTHVAPGKKGEIIWTFNRAGDFDFACLIAGHYQGGMVGNINVVASKQETGHGKHKH